MWGTHRRVQRPPSERERNELHTWNQKQCARRPHAKSNKNQLDQGILKRKVGKRIFSPFRFNVPGQGRKKQKSLKLGHRVKERPEISKKCFRMGLRVTVLGIKLQIGLQSTKTSKIHFKLSLEAARSHGTNKNAS